MYAPKVYVASSWRNMIQPEVVGLLRQRGWEVYDFRHPSEDDHGFHWSEIDPAWKMWGPEQFKEALQHPLAKNGFAKDMAALAAADFVVLVQPCGRSAHLELGYAVGAGKRTAIVLSEAEPELMYKMVDFLCHDMAYLIEVSDRIHTQILNAPTNGIKPHV